MTQHLESFSVITIFGFRECSPLFAGQLKNRGKQGERERKLERKVEKWRVKERGTDRERDRDGRQGRTRVKE